MATNFNQDSGFVSAVTKCSPNIQRFVNGLNTGKDPTGEMKEFPVDFNFLIKLGCLQTDGDGKFFRVLDFYNDRIRQVQHGAYRDFKEQQELFKIGRKIGVEEKISISLVAPEGLRGASVVFTDVVKTGNVVTNLAGGASYHNYGLACDIVLRHYGDYLKSTHVVRVDGVLYDSFKKIYEKSGLLRWAAICHLEWGGDWIDFPDFAHFQDKDYKPLPYIIYGSRCLQNEANCNFESVAKYWAGKWSNTFDTYLKQIKASLDNVLFKTDIDKMERWQTWTVGRGSTKGYSGKGDGKGGIGLLAGLLSVPMLVVAGLILYCIRNDRRR